VYYKVEFVIPGVKKKSSVVEILISYITSCFAVYHL
jgi:hypothetical protein